MATDYKINGSAASIGPTTVTWTPIQMGHGHDGRVSFSKYWNVTMEFDAASVTEAAQWLDYASGLSVNLTLPNKTSIAFITLSSVYMEALNPPPLTTTYVSGFTIQVRRAIPQ